ncbi:transglutaminase family protein [Actinotalea sp.]|uniref:transglutaminase-like domain-containing protein n=1 Tax=Actinotalea sp. TaxID=1872145 RepID=UPI003566F70E
MRSVSAHLEADVHTSSDVVLLVAAAHGASTEDPAARPEELDVRIDGVPVDLTELHGPHGTRVHTLSASPGHLTVEYRAEVSPEVTPITADPLDVVTYLRPSRYVESDTLVGLAGAELRGLSGVDLLHGARSWVAERFTYVPGSTRGSDGVRDVLLSRRGVCRDYAHVVAGLLRAVDVPARTVSVYAPGLAPMDFHAVVEAYLDGTWYVLDATGLAPRGSMVRIATGRDTADTAFLSTYRGGVTLRSLRVTATEGVAQETEPDDALVQLA